MLEAQYDDVSRSLQGRVVLALMGCITLAACGGEVSVAATGNGTGGDGGGTSALDGGDADADLDAALPNRPTSCETPRAGADNACGLNP